MLIQSSGSNSWLLKCYNKPKFKECGWIQTIYYNRFKISIAIIMMDYSLKVALNTINQTRPTVDFSTLLYTALRNSRLKETFEILV
jgi:hypothetical protein